MRSNVDFSTGKIAEKLFETQYKIDVEKKIQEGAERMLEAFKLSGYQATDKKLKKETQKNLHYSIAKTALLNNVLNKYNSLKIDDQVVSVEHIGAKGVVSGTLRIKICQVADLNLTGISNLRNEGFCIVRVDNIVRGKTKTKSKLIWNEEFEIKLEKATELEISFFDKNKHLQGLVFFRLIAISKDPIFVSGSNESFDLEPRGSLQCFIKFEEQKTPTRRVNGFNISFLCLEDDVL